MLGRKLAKAKNLGLLKRFAYIVAGQGKVVNVHGYKWFGKPPTEH